MDAVSEFVLNVIFAAIKHDTRICRDSKHLANSIRPLIKPQIFLLNVAMLLLANYLLLLMKQQIDELIAQDRLLQEFLTWVSLKSQDVPADYKPVTVRAFYFDLAMARALGLVGGTLDLARTFDYSLTCHLERNLALDLVLDRTLGLDEVIELTREPTQVVERVLERANSHARAFEPMLEQALLQLLEQLPSKARDPKKFKRWWSVHGRAWTEQLRAVLIEYRNLGHNWQFSDQQRDTLKLYYDANQVLVDCLNSYLDVAQPVREEIEKTLLLPIAEMSVANSTSTHLC